MGHLEHNSNIQFKCAGKRTLCNPISQHVGGIQREGKAEKEIFMVHTPEITLEGSK